jgi:hypothetical protein
MRAGMGEVSTIVFDEEAFHRFDVKRYLVYLQTDEGQVLWKSIENMPVIIELDLNF